QVPGRQFRPAGRLPHVYIIAIAWIYVTLLMALTEQSFVAGLATFLFYGLFPLTLLLWLLGTPQRRRRRRREAEAARLPVEPVERVERVEAVEAVAPVEPVAPVEQVEPVEPVEVVERVEPVSDDADGSGRKR